MAGARPVIAAFDFDGTLTRRNTLPGFLRHTFGWTGLVSGLFKLGPTFGKSLVGLSTPQEAKEALLSHYFKGWPLERFDCRCMAYASDRLATLLKGEALICCWSHQQQGHCLVCVSASIRNWIAPWALNHGFSHVIATEMEVQSGRLTGRFQGKNCNGAEKVRRFLELFPDRGGYELYVYGDSVGDRELLALADHPFYRRFV